MQLLTVTVSVAAATDSALRAAGRSCRFVAVPPRTRRLLELGGRTDLLAGA